MNDWYDPTNSATFYTFLTCFLVYQQLLYDPIVSFWDFEVQTTFFNILHLFNFKHSKEHMYGTVLGWKSKAYLFQA